MNLENMGEIHQKAQSQHRQFHMEVTQRIQEKKVKRTLVEFLKNNLLSKSLNLKKRIRLSKTLSKRRKLKVSRASL
jgi:hypothetical protein